MDYNYYLRFDKPLPDKIDPEILFIDGIRVRHSGMTRDACIICGIGVNPSLYIEALATGVAHSAHGMQTVAQGRISKPGPTSMPTRCMTHVHQVSIYKPEMNRPSFCCFLDAQSISRSPPPEQEYRDTATRQAGLGVSGVRSQPGCPGF
jgi:hypothetical protein